MEYKNETLGVSFSVPDKITVRDQLRYKGANVVSGESADLFIRLWAGACVVVQDWKCKTVALDADIDKITDPKAADVIRWVGLQVHGHMSNLGEIPKN